MILQVHNLSKSYGANPILKSIHLQVQPKERIGLVGVNGAGKTTLLRILSGELLPDSGEVLLAKGVRLGYLEQSWSGDEQLSIWEALLSGFAPLVEMEQELRQLEQQISRSAEEGQRGDPDKLLARYAALSARFEESGGYAMESKVRGILNGLGLGQHPPDTPVSSLSGGQKTRLALGRLLLQEPELLLLDEPTNYLDMSTMDWLEGILEGYPGAVVAVSHDRYFLERFATRIVELEQGRLISYPGNYSAYLEQKAKRLAQWTAQYKQQQQEIWRMQEFIQRNLARASTSRRAQSRRKALEKMEKVAPPPPVGEDRPSFGFTARQLSGHDVLQVQELTVTLRGQALFAPVSFSLSRGDRVALVGPNGVGKSTLLKAILDQLPRELAVQGQIRWGSKVEAGYYDQEQLSLPADSTVLDALWEPFRHLPEARIRGVLGNFLFTGEEVFKKVRELSGGERARLLLARLMLAQPNLLILDEPTNHLDLTSREVLENALEDYDGTLLVISHDRYFMDRLANRILELSPQGLTEYLGNWSQYMEKKQILQQQAELAQSPGSPARTSPPPADRKQQRERRRLERRRQKIEEELEQLEQEAAQIQEQMALPELATDHEKLLPLQEKLDEINRRLEQLYEEWVELEQ